MSVAWLARGVATLPESSAWLSPAERAKLEGLRFPKRRRDWLLGRYTAKCALAHVLGLGDRPESLAALEVRSADDGSPHAFHAGRLAGIAISLSDRAGFAVCALRRGDGGIGCDLELVEPRSEAFVADYLTERERTAVAEARRPGERELLANLVWSAKESALKVLRSGLRRDTRDVEVELHGGLVAGWSPLTVRTVEGVAFPGWWRRYGRFVVTFAGGCTAGPPRSLEEPPALECAHPVPDP